MKLSREAVGRRIRMLCKECGFSLQELSRRSGVSPSTIYNLVCSYRSSPRINTIIRLCEAFPIELEAFFSGPCFEEDGGAPQKLDWEGPPPATAPTVEAIKERNDFLARYRDFATRLDALFERAAFCRGIGRLEEGEPGKRQETKRSGKV